MEKNERYDKLLNDISILFPKNNSDNIRVDTYRLIPYMLLSKYVKTLKSVYFLDMNGFNESAKVLIRSMYEILIIIIYSNINHTESYTRYIKYSYVKKKQLIDTLSTEELKKINDLDVINQEYNNFLKKYNVDLKKKNQIYNWNGLSFKKTMEISYDFYKIDDIKDFYNTFYKLDSDIIHSGSNEIINSYFKIDEGKMIFDSNPKKDLKDNSSIERTEILNELLIKLFKKYL